MAYLYTFHNNILKGYEAHFDDDPGFHPHNDTRLRYIHTNEGDIRRIVPVKEGEAHSNQLWLSERDDELAAIILIKSCETTIIKLDAKIQELQDQIKRLYLSMIPIKSKEEK